MKHILVIGANFAGTTAALEIKRKMKGEVEVTVIDRKEQSLYFPSLIWLATGRREIEQVLIPRKPAFDKHGIRFVIDTATSVDPDKQEVYTEKSGTFAYDHLVIATGPQLIRDIAPGVREHSSYVGSVDGAFDLRKKLEELKKNPGPIVVGTTQTASCMGAAYEFLFDIEKWLREQKIRDKVDLYWITPETYLGHFGIDGMFLGETYLTAFMKIFNIKYRTEVGVKEVTDHSIILDTGEELQSKITMLMVPFRGVDFIKNSPQLEPTERLFLDVKPSYQHKKYSNIWAAGLAVDVPAPFKQGRIPFGVPKTIYPSNASGQIVAENIARSLRGRTDLKEKSWGRIPAFCVMDAGKKEVVILGTSLFKPRTFAIMIPNVVYDITKVTLEKYYIWKMRNGYSHLP